MYKVITLVVVTLGLMGCQKDNSAEINELRNSVNRLEATVDALSQKITSNTKEVVTNPRVVLIGAVLSLKGIPYNEYYNYLLDVQGSIAVDEREIVLRHEIAKRSNAQPLYVRTGETQVTIADTWVVDFQNTQASLLSELPAVPLMYVNNEAIPFNKCEEGSKPTLVYLKAYRIGTQWDSDFGFIVDEENKQWVVTMDDIEPLSETAFDRRVLVISRCALEQ